MAASSFSGSIPQAYHTFLGPLIFEPYAIDIATRAAIAPGERVLELACGTGIVTKQLLHRASYDARLVATDINQAMLDICTTFVGRDPRLIVQVADACSLPFADSSFDLLIAQFGMMFFADKVAAMREARRVLGANGRCLFNVWSSFEHNPIPRAVHESLHAQLPSATPTFLARLPFGYHDPGEIERVTREGGFVHVRVHHVDLPCVAPTAHHAARGFIEGTPVRTELTEKGIADPAPYVDVAAKQLASRFGNAPCRATMRALVVEAW